MPCNTSILATGVPVPKKMHLHQKLLFISILSFARRPSDPKPRLRQTAGPLSPLLLAWPVYRGHLLPQDLLLCPQQWTDIWILKWSPQLQGCMAEHIPEVCKSIEFYFLLLLVLVFYLSMSQINKTWQRAGNTLVSV